MKKYFFLLVFILPNIVFASIDTNLKYGAHGQEVTELQEFLISKGFLSGQATGNFFSLTQKAVIAYQTSISVPSTGFVGLLTRAKINEDLLSTNTFSNRAEITNTNIVATSTQNSQTTRQQQLQDLQKRIAQLMAQMSQLNQNPTQQASSTTANSTHQTFTTPSGAIMEMDENGNIVGATPVTQNIPQFSVRKTLNITSNGYPADLLLQDAKTNIRLISIRFFAGGDTESIVNGVPIQLAHSVTDTRVNNIYIKLSGSASPSILKSLRVLPGSDARVSSDYTPNSSGEVTFSTSIIIPSGEFRDYSIVADIADDSSSEQGKNISVSIVSVNTDAQVIASLPITGYAYTVAARPTPLPKVTASPGKVDIRNNQPYKKPGTKDYIFSGIKITSDKDVLLNSIKWSMSGNSGGENLKTYLGDTSYIVERSLDGKYYTSNFNSAVVSGGEVKEIYLKGDIAESNNGTIDFNINNASDVNITDKNGRVIIPKADQLWNYENSGGFRSSTWYDGYKVEMEPLPLNP